MMEKKGIRASRWPHIGIFFIWRSQSSVALTRGLNGPLREVHTHTRTHTPQRQLLLLSVQTLHLVAPLLPQVTESLRTFPHNMK